MKTELLESRIVLPRILLAFAAGMLVSSLFLPIWQIQLTAPQYPEGLVLKIFASKLAGDVNIINGLNHYIGMQTLHEEDFIEFTVLPYIIVFLIIWQIVTIFINRKKWYLINTIIFIVIAIVCMSDFYRWEYNYGHNLNPEAPIQVPGMSYDPPLIGYKQLLNFSAFSIPDTGGWMYITAGVLIVVSYFLILRPKWLGFKTSHLAVSGIYILFFLSGCSQNPQPINYGKDGCDFCRMTIMDTRFACEIVTNKGKQFHFDDTHCLLNYMHDNKIKNDDVNIYVNNFNNDHKFLKAGDAFFVKDENLKTPMNGNLAAFTSQNEAQQYAQQHTNSQVISFNQLISNP